MPARALRQGPRAPRSSSERSAAPISACKSGVSTGCAPLKALELTPANLAFLGQLVRKLVSVDGRPLSVADESRIDAGLAAMRDLPREERSLSALRVFLGQRDPEGIGARLERWCKGGPLGWVLDADEDSISLDALALGFDMTDVLDHAAVRTPLMMYLFHRVEELIDGRRIVIAIDEFWKALGDEAFRALANDGLKTIRKKNGVMVFGTQSPRDALASPIAHTIVEQCPTQVFFPNPRGQLADYVEGFHLTRTEFRLIREDLAPESRRFLIKQGHHAVVAELDLERHGRRALPSCQAGPRTSSSSTASGAKSAMTRPTGCLCFSNSERSCA